MTISDDKQEVAKCVPKKKHTTKTKGQFIAEFWHARRFRVRMRIPEFGFGETTDLIVAFCESRGESIRSLPSSDREDRWTSRCFAFLSEQNAKDFVAQFGGEYEDRSGDQLSSP